jgi:hypothetical protein
MSQVARALERADEARRGALTLATPSRAPRRAVAIGDPQTTAERFFAVLAHHDLLDDDGVLRADVQLASLGDHFDFNPRHRAPAGQAVDGARILAWLAAHPREQVTIVIGNHDASRVMEFSHATDARIAAARGQLDAPAAEFARAFPELPVPGLIAKDYLCFVEAQRAQVERLLLAGRMSLAATAARGGHRRLLVHAGVTMREVDLLGCAVGVAAIADALQAHLARAVDAVRARWIAGERAALDLGDVHVAGDKGRDDVRLREGGGLLYHRPADPARMHHDADRPRRYDPRTLPRGVVQVVGHTNDRKCRRELAPWLAADLPAYAAVRTLAVGDAADDVVYRAGVIDGVATGLVLADPDMSHAAVEDIAIVELDPGTLR